MPAFRLKHEASTNMTIHPTAIVDPTAEVHESVQIGPYTVIEPNVRIGPDNIIASCIRIYSGTTLGRANQVFHNCVLGCPPQDLSFDPDAPSQLVIGDHNTFREGANIHRSTDLDHPTVIGHHNHIMGSVHIGHDCRIGDYNTITHFAGISGHCEVGNHIHLGGMGGLHQYVRAGDYTMLGGFAKINQDVPPYTTVDGNPAQIVGINAIGLRRAGFSSQTRSTIKSAYRTIYKSDLNIGQAVAELEGRNPIAEVRKIIEFIKNSARGLTGHR
jgi:UDP-N-acetylglucosamine acyltransferase